eukprot:scaffold316597_cov29-Attheya_sp.AAC.1
MRLVPAVLMLAAFLKFDGWLSRSTYNFVEQSGGRLGLFAFRCEQSMHLVFVVLKLVAFLESDV